MKDDVKYKFILVNNETGDHICDLDTEFVSDEADGSGDNCDVWSSDAACAEALYKLGYNVKVVKK